MAPSTRNSSAATFPSAPPSRTVTASSIRRRSPRSICSFTSRAARLGRMRWICGPGSKPGEVNQTQRGDAQMPAKVEFHFDFGIPNAYFAHQLIPAIETRTGAHFDYVPILLGGVFKLTNNQPPMLQFKGIKNKSEYQRLEVRRFIKKHGLTRF